MLPQAQERGIVAVNDVQFHGNLTEQTVHTADLFLLGSGTALLDLLVDQRLHGLRGNVPHFDGLDPLKLRPDGVIGFLPFWGKLWIIPLLPDVVDLVHGQIDGIGQAGFSVDFIQKLLGCLHRWKIPQRRPVFFDPVGI